jgi:NAD(P)-dependent dehydrogenase (short-subunit alcohol dehydrogenase family)
MQQLVTIVTGSSRGIGEATAKLLAENGHLVIGTGRHKPANPPGPFFEIDFSDANETSEALLQIVNEFEVDHLVNNAGVSQARSVLETTVSDLDLHYAVNLRAAVQCAQAVIPSMIKKGRGRIVNVSSRAVLGRANRTPYAASKAGLLSLSRCWALELAESGITVNTVAPGPIRTKLFDKNHPVGSDAYNSLLQTVPAKKFGTPGEIAAPIAFLLSDGAAYINGQVIYVCGGASIGSAPI